MVLTVSAQSYPTKPLRLIVTYPAGVSTNDILGRAIGQRLTEALAQNVVVDNGPGASDPMGTEMVERAPADHS